MKFNSALLVVKHIDKSVEFYKKVLGLHLTMDLELNKTSTGGLGLQRLETWREFIGTNNISFGVNNTEVYFEAVNFDKFVEKLKEFDINYVHPLIILD